MPQNIAVPVVVGTLLSDAARTAGISMETPCDGAGTCGKCKAKVRVEDRRLLSENVQDSVGQTARDGGWVLACQTVVLGDVEVELETTVGDGLQILSDGQTLTVEIDPWIRKSFDPATSTTNVSAGDSVLTTQQVYGVAVDIRTTTLVVTLLDLRSGRELGVSSSLSPQALHAQDVLSRIKMGSEPEGLQKLHGELIREINRQVAELAAQAGVVLDYTYEAVFSGNTTMLHLTTATDPVSLGKYPYALALAGGQHVGAREIGMSISQHGLVYLPPIMSADVGPDITSGILSTRLAEQPGVVLLVDIGTNGEIVLSVDGRLTATSTAAGPAFEGMNIACGMRASRGAIESVSLGEDGIRVETIADAAPVGICGSGLVDVVGGTRRAGRVE